MSTIDSDKEIEVYKAEVQTVSPYSNRARLRLNTVHLVSVEMARLYKAARSGKIKTEDATRLCYILSTLANTIKDSDLEQRVEALENSR